MDGCGAGGGSVGDMHAALHVDGSPQLSTDNWKEFNHKVNDIPTETIYKYMLCNICILYIFGNSGTFATIFSTTLVGYATIFSTISTLAVLTLTPESQMLDK